MLNKISLTILIVLVIITNQAIAQEQVGTDNTFEAVTWNIEWLGTSGQGPSNESLQLANAAFIMSILNADFYALQEIRDQDTLDDLISALNGSPGISTTYTGFVAPHVGCCQRMAFVYNTETVTLRNLGGVTQGQSEFAWAGRIPFFLEFDATINGITRTIYSVNIHAKAFADQSSYNRRVEAAGDLYDFFVDETGSDAILFLGDYNDDVDVSTFNENTTPYIDFAGDFRNFRILSKVLSDQKRASTVNGSEMIDHITVSDELFEDIVEDDGILIHDPREYINNYGNTTSDHFPIVSIFSFQLATSNDTDTEIPREVELFQNYPNPFNPSTTIEFLLNSPQQVTLTVYNTNGQEITRLIQNQRLSSGRHSVNLDASNLSSGVYFYQLSTDAITLTRSLTLIK